MKFYYDIHSKDGVVYQPMGFAISVGKKCMAFDLEGNSDYNVEGGVIKGELSIRTESDVVEATEKDIDRLKSLVKQHHMCTVFLCADDDAEHPNDSITGFAFTLYVHDELIMNEDHCDVEVCD